ncbi:hypothetical protein BDZ91DRAFT_442355 [Kalaharituber pfeilii]|nr:hypothetical protein BDZ91DRAFT_442355 [Kalaharituber pfeilii]
MQEGRVRPAATYPQNSPEKLSKQLFGRYHIIAPLPKEGPLQIQRLEASAPINPNLSSNCHYMSPTLTPLGQPDSNYTSPQSASRHSVFFREKRHLRSPKNTILPFHPSVRERHTWSRVSRRMNMTVGTVKRSVSTPNVQQAASLSAASGEEDLLQINGEIS